MIIRKSRLEESTPPRMNSVLYIVSKQKQESQTGVQGMLVEGMGCFMVLLFLFTTCAGFKVSVPAGRVIAARGQPAALGCQFPPDSTLDLSPLVVTWQRVEDSRVVHSFYYTQDQLKLQSAEYRNRTTLFVSELRKGNATLRIEPVGPKDAGGYLCTVSNDKGTDKAQVQLEYGAFYTEPRLSINVNCSAITLLYETEGFPKPEVSWFGEHDEVLSNHTDLSGDAAVGLYHLRSRFASPSLSLNVTFRLKNQLLNQVLHRPVSIMYGGENCGWGFTLVPGKLLIALCVLCVLLLICTTTLLIKRRLSNDGRHGKRGEERSAY